MTWLVIRLEDRETGDSATYGPFKSHDVGDLNTVRVDKWLDDAGTRNNISVSYERVSPFSRQALAEDGWLTPTDQDGG